MLKKGTKAAPGSGALGGWWDRQVVHLSQVISRRRPRRLGPIRARLCLLKNELLTCSHVRKRECYQHELKSDHREGRRSAGTHHGS